MEILQVMHDNGNVTIPTRYEDDDDDYDDHGHDHDL